MNAQHSSASPLWYTRDEHIEAAKIVLGKIDLDPASDETGNARVGATTFLTEEMDGLQHPWIHSGQGPISVWMNPPGGKLGNESIPVLFWERLMALREMGCLKHAIVAAFSLEQFQTTQRCIKTMGQFPFCIPRGRVKWLGRPGQRATSPTHSSAFVYVPGTLDARMHFATQFSRFGLVRM